MNNNGAQPIAREGRPTLLVLVLATILANTYIGLWAALPCLLLLLVAAYIFRNPRRQIPSSPLAVVSPVSGKLLAVEQIDDHNLERKAIRFRIRVSLWDVHAVYSPVEGKVMKQWKEDLDDPDYNRRFNYWLKTDEDDDLVFSLILGKWSPFTRMYIRSGERVGQGQVCGYLYYSGIIELLMPANSRIISEPGQRLAAGSDIVGKFIHGEGATVIGK